jgi:SpoVK/Ycf46/Vps4 family AAA+-type ATPase
MDGFNTEKGVIIMAATNRPEILDPALLRPGRFDRHVMIDKPDIQGREAILRVHSKGVILSPEVDLHVIASRTPGFVGADLANIVNEAALLAARKDKKEVDMKDFDDAIDRVIAGLEKKKSARRRRQTSTPSISGITRSSRTRWGGSAAARRTASLPVATASTSTGMPLRSRKRVIRWRKSRSSSTTRVR